MQTQIIYHIGFVIFSALPEKESNTADFSQFSCRTPKAKFKRSHAAQCCLKGQSCQGTLIFVLQKWTSKLNSGQRVFSTLGEKRFLVFCHPGNNNPNYLSKNQPDLLCFSQLFYFCFLLICKYIEYTFGYFSSFWVNFRYLLSKIQLFLD